jgi:16S rRNA (cytosine1402-N4)-methyltransferase
LLREALGFLNLKRGDVVLDATVGGGGHAREILKAVSPGGRLIGLDADGSAIRRAEANLKDYAGSFKLINDNFRNLDAILAKEDIASLNGCLFDVGVSSYQLDDQSRGFSMKNNAPLDMRMDQRGGTTAYDIVNRYKEKELSEMIEKFGEERFHKKIAAYIVRYRAAKPIETTAELAAIIHKAVGLRRALRRIDPATRTFQAVRIAVNDELVCLEEGLKKAVFWLAPGARICVISFHSLEDRIVKNLFKGYAGLGVLRILTKRPVSPSDEEIASNIRARSAKMRVAERME